MTAPTRRETLARVVAGYARLNPRWATQRLAQLILDGTYLAQINGHAMSRWTFDDKYTAVSHCTECGLWAIACSIPDEDDDELSGSCLAVACVDGAIPTWAQ